MQGIPISIRQVSPVKPNDLINIVQVSPGKAETIYENIRCCTLMRKQVYAAAQQRKIEVLLALGDSIRWYYSPMEQLIPL